MIGSCFLFLFAIVLMVIAISLASSGEQQRKKQEWEQEQKRRQQQQEEERRKNYNSYRQLVSQNWDKIEKFYSFVESKVSKLDKYGDENWGAFDRELWILLEKLASNDGRFISGIEFIKNWKRAEKRSEYFNAGPYHLLREHIRNEFKNRHDALKSNTQYLDNT